ncbi:Predicted acyltransferase [Zhouia amylolytica]|uniref:Predicted acyltransferase n=1 Tax=Zhouia amylolytica TaxID=376730 RepID=A0A1I6QYD0_9FLAO|nr:heparan-alpha-glucosaminide N-acetyltransferase domain-containing protein [Zhouia amylolytica]SFS57423.1 Predicted acyltransferase [Zhouia amylolytica]
MKNRILSIDVLRGLTICLMIIVNTPGSWSYVYPPLQHASWHGCTPTDLVFPSFLFVIGLSMSISLKKLNSSNAIPILKKLIKRGGIIFIIGLLLNWFPFYQTHISDLRVFGVLQRIALAFILAGILISLIRQTSILIITAFTLLITHWALLYFLGGDNPFGLETNLGRSIDLFVIGENHMYNGFGIPFDPEGLLGTLSSSAQVLLGYIIGKNILQKGTPSAYELNRLALISLMLIFISLIWNIIYPINKPLWTGSYTLYTTGIITGVWGILIWIIDIRKKDRWTLPFKVFGQNPLASYILSIIVVKLFIYVFKVGNTSLYGWSFKNIFQTLFDNHFASFTFALVFTFMIWLVAFWLYKKGKIIKI